MRRARWSVPSAAIAWLVVGFTPWFLGRWPDDPAAFVPSDSAQVDVLVIGGLIGGAAAGLLVRRFWIALPVVLVVAVAAWWSSAGSVRPDGLLITLLVASSLGAMAGSLGTHGSVLAALALTLPLAAYSSTLADELRGWRWSWELNGLLVAVSLTALLYVACWRKGWRAVLQWPVITAAYLVSFAVVQAADQVAAGFARGRTGDEIADLGTDAFFSAFEPLLVTYWSWLVAAVLLAVPMAALKIRALPPTQPPADVDDERGNDARLSDDLDWIDLQEETRTRRLPRREPVG